MRPPRSVLSRCGSQLTAFRKVSLTSEWSVTCLGAHGAWGKIPSHWSFPSPPYNLGCVYETHQLMFLVYALSRRGQSQHDLSPTTGNTESKNPALRS